MAITEKSKLLKSLLSLSMVVEARDAYTGGHLWRVSQFSRLLAESLGLSKDIISLAEAGGFLHDLGKISLPDDILHNSGSLTTEQLGVVHTHPTVGEHLLKPHPLGHLVLDAVGGHHEMINGQGYPRKLNGSKIPMIARLVGIADAFDAITSCRSYHPAFSISFAMNLIKENLGSHFDIEMGTNFLSLAESDEVKHIVGHSEPGIPLQYCPCCQVPIALHHNHKIGDFVYCRKCKKEAKIVKQNEKYSLQDTGLFGDSFAVAPSADFDLVDQMIENIGSNLFAK